MLAAPLGESKPKEVALSDNLFSMFAFKMRSDYGVGLLAPGGTR
jgi:hypothetical protein